MRGGIGFEDEGGKKRAKVKGVKGVRNEGKGTFGRQVRGHERKRK